jgi:hypothetical protein
MRNYEVIFIAFLIIPFILPAAQASDLSSSMKVGKPDLLSVGPLAFAPGGVLLVGDPAAGAVFAIETGDGGGSSPHGPIAVEGIDVKAAALFGISLGEIRILDMAVNPSSGKAYLSASRGRGQDALPAILRVEPGGRIAVLDLENVRFAKALLDRSSGVQQHAPETMTELTYVNGRVFVACASGEAATQTLRAASFLFDDAGAETSVEGARGSEGPLETLSHVRTLASDAIESEPYLLADFNPAPVSRLSSDEERANLFGALAPDGRQERLIIQTMEARPYQAIHSMKGVQQLDRLDDQRAVVLIQAVSGSLDLETITLP